MSIRDRYNAAVNTITAQRIAFCRLDEDPNGDRYARLIGVRDSLGNEWRGPNELRCWDDLPGITTLMVATSPRQFPHLCRDVVAAAFADEGFDVTTHSGIVTVHLS